MTFTVTRTKYLKSHWYNLQIKPIYTIRTFFTIRYTFLAYLGKQLKGDIMFNANKTFRLIKEGLLAPKQMWENYLKENHAYKETAIILTIPLVLISVVITSILSWIFSSYFQSGIGATFVHILLTLIGISVASFIFSYFMFLIILYDKNQPNT